MERSKEKLDLYYSLKTLAPVFQLINHRHPKFMEVLKLEYVYNIINMAFIVNTTKLYVYLIVTKKYDKIFVRCLIVSILSQFTVTT